MHLYYQKIAQQKRQELNQTIVEDDYVVLEEITPVTEEQKPDPWFEQNESELKTFEEVKEVQPLLENGIAPPPIGFGINIGQGTKSRYIVPSTIEISDFNGIDPSPSESQKEVKSIKKFIKKFPEFDIPEWEPLYTCHHFVVNNPIPKDCNDIRVLAPIEEGVKKAATKDKKDLQAKCSEHFDNYKKQLDETLKNNTEYEQQEWSIIRRNLLEEVENKYPCAIGETLSAEVLKQKEDYGAQVVGMEEEKCKQKIKSYQDTYNTSMKKLTDAYNAYIKRESSRIELCVSDHLVIYHRVLNQHRQENQKKKREKVKKEMKIQWWDPFDKWYKEKEPKWFTPLRRFLFSFDQESGQHRLVLLYHWFDKYKLLGLLVLLISILYATGYIEKWFVTPYNVFNHPRSEFLDSKGRLIQNTLTRFDFLNMEIHKKHVDWIYNNPLKITLVDNDFIEGFVSIPWSDGRQANISLGLIDYSMLLMVKREQRSCVCAAEIGVPLNIVYTGGFMMFEPSFSVQTKTQLKGRSQDIFSKKDGGEVIFPVSATTIFKLSDGRAKRMQTEKEENACIVRCDQILGNRKK